jgi:cation:H+ antiporter
MIDRVEGAVLLIALVLFIGYTVHIGRRDVRALEARQIAAHVESRDIDVLHVPTNARALLATGTVLMAGIAALVGGGHLLVNGAVALARVAGLSERVIGLTIVAGGTGAPELATSLVAAFRKRTDVAIANMIGSNIFNILGILGLTALINPVRVLPMLVRSDMWWMIGTSLLLFPLMRSRRRLDRIEGTLLFAAYVVYLAVLLGH